MENQLERKIEKLEAKMENHFIGMEGKINVLQWMMAFLLGGMLSLILKSFF